MTWPFRDLIEVYKIQEREFIGHVLHFTRKIKY